MFGGGIDRTADHRHQACRIWGRTSQFERLMLLFLFAIILKWQQWIFSPDKVKYTVTNCTKGTLARALGLVFK